MKRTLIILLTLALFSGSVFAQNPRNRQLQEHKFVFMTSLGYSGGIGDIALADYDCHDLVMPPALAEDQILKTVKNNNFNIQVNQLLAYQFNNFFYMGVGAGIDFWNHTAFVPLYLNFSVNMMQTRVAPTAFVNLGWGFKWYLSSVPETVNHVIHGSNQGPMGEAGIGMRIKITDKIAIVLAGTYKLQYSKIRYTIPEVSGIDNSAFFANSIQPALYHFAGIKLGILY